MQLQGGHSILELLDILDLHLNVIFILIFLLENADFVPNCTGKHTGIKFKMSTFNF